MRHMEVLAPAKINLFLKILSKRSDAYHNIETVFEKISLFDRLILKEGLQDRVTIKSNIKSLSINTENNTICKAIALIKKRFKIKKGIEVFLDKNIPIGAGLGGGSSDAAAALKGINKLWKLGLSQKELWCISRDIGSDVPLFISEGSFLLGKGRGEELSEIKDTGDLRLWHVLVVPDFKISTPYAYALFDRCFLSKEGVRIRGVLAGKLRLTIPAYGANIITYALFNRDVSLLNYYSYNSFRSVVLKRFTRLSRLSRVLEKTSGDFAHLSGSGSTLFLTFSDRKEAEYLVRKLSKAVRRCSIFLVHTC